jgi:hypothetical protein
LTYHSLNHLIQELIMASKLQGKLTSRLEFSEEISLSFQHLEMMKQHLCICTESELKDPSEYNCVVFNVKVER